jgi:hypothetical protein
VAVSQLGEVSPEQDVAQFGHGAGELHTGGTTPHHDDGEVAVVGTVCGCFEALQHVVADDQGVAHRLQWQGVLGNARDAEVGGHGSRCEDEVVVGQGTAVPEHHLATGEVDRRHDCLTDVDVVPARVHRTETVGDVLRGEAGGRHLVEQWRERVVVGPVDQGHLHVGPSGRPRETLNGTDAGEPTTDDDDM